MISQTNCYKLDAGSIYKGLLSVTPNKGIQIQLQNKHVVTSIKGQGQVQRYRTSDMDSIQSRVARLV